MTKKMIRDTYGDPVPQLQNEDGSFTVLSNGDTTGVDFSKYKLIRDAHGDPIPYQYFDTGRNKFVAGVIGGGSGGTDITEHVTSDAPHRYGGKFEWRYNATTNSLDLVVIE